jgi:hypothetical protein
VPIGTNHFENSLNIQAEAFQHSANLIYGTPVQKLPQFIRDVIAAIE